MQLGALHPITGMAMGLLDVPSAAALWNFVWIQLPQQTAEVISHFRMAIVVAGLVVGFLVGLTGVGGGILLTPVLVLFGVAPTVAVGSDLLYSSATKLVGVHLHWKRGSVDWGWVRYLAMGSVPASLAAVYLLHIIQHRFGSADHFVQKSLGIVLLVAAFLTFANEVYSRLRGAPKPTTPVDVRAHAGKIISLGLVVGFMVGLTSLGSGAVVAVVLMAFSRLPAKKIVGTDIAHALLLVTAAAFAHWQLGTVDVGLAANLLVGSLPGVALGSRLAYYAPARPLKVGMALLVLIGGLRMFFPL